MSTVGHAPKDSPRRGVRAHEHGERHGADAVEGREIDPARFEVQTRRPFARNALDRRRHHAVGRWIDTLGVAELERDATASRIDDPFGRQVAGVNLVAGCVSEREGNPCAVGLAARSTSGALALIVMRSSRRPSGAMQRFERPVGPRDPSPRIGPPAQTSVTVQKSPSSHDAEFASCVQPPSPSQ